MLKWEGGFSNHKNDLGGATNKGVTLRTLKSIGLDKDMDGDVDINDLKLLTNKDVTYKVLKPFYWDRVKADNINCQKVANALVDYIWTSGNKGIIAIQRILNVSADGIVGNKTIKAINDYDCCKLFKELNHERELYFYHICNRRPKNKVFLKGWLNRLNDLRNDNCSSV